MYTIFMQCEDEKFYLDSDLIRGTHGQFVRKFAYLTDSSKVAGYVCKVLMKARSDTKVEYFYESVDSRDEERRYEKLGYAH